MKENPVGATSWTFFPQQLWFFVNSQNFSHRHPTLTTESPVPINVGTFASHEWITHTELTVSKMSHVNLQAKKCVDSSSVWDVTSFLCFNAVGNKTTIEIVTRHQLHQNDLYDIIGLVIMTRLD